MVSMIVFCKMLPGLLGTMGRGGKADFLLPWLDNVSRRNAHSSWMENSFTIKGGLYLKFIWMRCQGAASGSCSVREGEQGAGADSKAERAQGPKKKEQSRSGDGNQGQPVFWWLLARCIAMRQVYGQGRIRQDPGKIAQGNTVLFRQEPRLRTELKCSCRAPPASLLVALSHTALSPECDPRSQGCITSLLISSTGSQTSLGVWRACRCRSLTKSDIVWFWDLKPRKS